MPVDSLHLRGSSKVLFWNLPRIYVGPVEDDDEPLNPVPRSVVPIIDESGQLVNECMNKLPRKANLFAFGT